MLFVGNDDTIGHRRKMGGSSAVSGPEASSLRPAHCGQAMQLTVHRAAGDSTLSSPQAGDDLRLVWQCRCGFTLDPQPDPREDVWAAAASVETCQWEMDQALLQLRTAIRSASAKGVSSELLADAGQLSCLEIQSILNE
ncbi:hypothetical protein M1E17_19900 [Arthrobacter sp. D1-29]